ncbi:hypothetical protein A0H76_1161 [Hepatospora eriocheir]|uniref:Uncharacterized protein n=1 Tax=Hepatospora eriocheir TaxID=1081669 RepID=A0A1X0QHK6_9MICR|nr:hypothetical protein A0H76_1161 [Hepatospora eriocheir]
MKREKKYDKLAIILGVAAVGAGIAYLTKKYLSKDSFDENYETALAHTLVKESKYLEALNKYKLLENKSKEILNQMIICYEKLLENDKEKFSKEFVDVLSDYINRFVDNKKELSFYVNKRLNLIENFNLDKESYVYLRSAFKDLFILTISDKKDENINEKAKKYLVQLTNIQVAKFQPLGDVSDIKFKDFFSLLPLFFEIIPNDFIRKGDFNAIYKHLVNSKSISENLVLKGIFNYIKGQHELSSTFYEVSDSKLAPLLKILSYSTYKTVDEYKLDEIIESNKESKSKYLTSLIIAAKICEEYNDIPKLELYLNKALEIIDKECIFKLVKPALNNLKLITLIKLKDHKAVVNFINENIKKVKNTGVWYKDNAFINFFCISTEYSLANKDYKLVSELYEKFSIFNDTRISLFKSIISIEFNKNDYYSESAQVRELERIFKKDCNEECNYFLDRAIDQDPKYFKNYIYYGNYLMGTEQSLSFYSKGLACATDRSEIYSVFHLLIVTEIQIEVLKSDIGRLLIE